MSTTLRARPTRKDLQMAVNKLCEEHNAWIDTFRDKPADKQQLAKDMFRQGAETLVARMATSLRWVENDY